MMGFPDVGKRCRFPDHRRLLYHSDDGQKEKVYRRMCAVPILSIVIIIAGAWRGYDGAMKALANEGSSWYYDKYY
jgi:hypothetical protein